MNRTSNSPRLSLFLRSHEVEQMFGGISDMTLWRWVKHQGFPKPKKINGRNQPHGARGFERLWLGPDGTRFYGYPIGADTTFCAFVITGEPLGRLTDIHRRLLEMRKELGDIESRCPRFDVAWDYCPFTPHQAYEEWQEGRVKSRIRKEQHLWISSTEGSTLYVGSSKSEKRVRIYDRRGYTRCELQARKQSAHSLFLDYLHFPDNLYGWLCGVATWEADWFQKLLAEPVRHRTTPEVDAFLCSDSEDTLLVFSRRSR